MNAFVTGRDMTLAMFEWMQVLSDATRARLLRLLERSELTVVELCAATQSPQSTVSRHLKVLVDAGWIKLRREGTSSWYHLSLSELDPAQKRLWQLVREQASTTKFAEHDDRRLEDVLAERQSRAQAFFSSAADEWDKLRTELFGSSINLWALAGAFSQEMVVGELGCGNAPLSRLLAPFVRQAIAVDSSPAMLKAAKGRLKKSENVDLRRGELNSLPIDDRTLDLAWLVLVLAYVSDPQTAIAETARVLKPRGRLLVIDMYRHDRQTLQQELGHVWLGFEESQWAQWLGETGFEDIKVTPLPTETGTKGPPLFCLTAVRGLK